MLLINNKGKEQFHRIVLEYLQNEKNTKILISWIRHLDLRDAVDCSGTTLLHLSAKYGNNYMTKYLKQSACNIDVQDNDGMTPLMVAIEHQQLDHVKLLLNLEVDIGIKNNLGKSALKIALEIDAEPLVKTLLDELSNSNNLQRSLDIMIEAGCKLYHVVHTRSPEIIDLLISKKVSINEQNPKDGNTALLTAAIHGFAPMIDTLLQHKADPTIRNNDGYLPFMYTMGQSLEGGATLVKEICQVIHSWTAREGRGKLFLQPIFSKCDRFTVELFLKTYDIDWKVGDLHGMTSLHYLAENGYPGAIDVLQDREIAVDVLQHVNVQDFNGRTPLHIAMLFMGCDNAEFLLKNGANPNVKDNEGRTPLFYAFLEDTERPNDDKSFDLKLMSLLLMYGADPEVMLDDQTTIIAEGVRDSTLVYLLKPVISHLVMREMLGKFINSNIRKQIMSKACLKNHFKSRCLQLEEMKKNRIFETVTLFHILTRPEIKLRRYAAKRENAIKVMRIDRKQITDLYYKFVYENQLKKIIEFAGIKMLSKQQDGALKPFIDSFMKHCHVKDD